MAPTPRDRALNAAILNEARLDWKSCSSLEELCRELKDGAGCALISEDALLAGGIAPVWETLNRQPGWSDLPIIVLTRGGKSDSPRLQSTVDVLGNVSLLEMPVRISTLISALQTALRARAKQYEIRDYIEKQEKDKEALRASEQRYHALVDAGSLLIYHASPDWSAMRLIESRSFAYNVRRDTGAWVQQYVHPEDQAFVRETIAKAVAAGTIVDMEHRIMREDGAVGWVSSRAIPLCNPGGEITEWFGATTDITARKEAESALLQAKGELEQRVHQRTAELQDAHAVLGESRQEVEDLNRALQRRTGQLAELTLELTNAEEQERRRIAHLLHDDLQQILVSAKFAVGMLSRRSADEDIRSGLKSIMDLLDQSITSSRSLTSELVPPMLYEKGLRDAVSWLAGWMKEKYGIEVTLLRPHDPPREASKELRVLLFQSIRELLFNIAKHANTNRATVALDYQGDLLSVRVQDEGTGFDLERAQRQGGAGFGLMSMRERLSAIGGRLEIDSAPGQGSTTTIRVPLHAMRNAA